MLLARVYITAFGSLGREGGCVYSVRLSCTLLYIVLHMPLLPPSLPPSLFYSNEIKLTQPSPRNTFSPSSAAPLTLPSHPPSLPLSLPPSLFYSNETRQTQPFLKSTCFPSLAALLPILTATQPAAWLEGRKEGGREAEEEEEGGLGSEG